MKQTEDEQEYIENPYDHLKAYDVISILQPLIDNGSYYVRPVDGKLEVLRSSIAVDTPWVHVKHLVGFNCGLWHQITFNLIVPQLPAGQKFVPRACQNCWKVVVKPRTLQQLFNLLEVEKALDRPSKCGIEKRDSVHGLYGGYFYNKTLEEGMDCYNIVKQAMRENKHLSPLVDEVDSDGKTTRVILKRACTEYEHLLGDSAKWKVTPEQEFLEDMISNYVVDEGLMVRQPDHIVWGVKRRWIEWAWKNGDPTYAKYTGGKPLYPPYVTYHPKEEKPKISTKKK